MHAQESVHNLGSIAFPSYIVQHSSLYVGVQNENSDVFNDVDTVLIYRNDRPYKRYRALIGTKLCKKHNCSHVTLLVEFVLTCVDLVDHYSIFNSYQYQPRNEIELNGLASDFKHQYLFILLVLTRTLEKQFLINES